MITYQEFLIRLAEKIEKEPDLIKILEKIKNHRADFNDTFEYSKILGKLIGRQLSSDIFDIDDREKACMEALKEAFDNVNRMLSQVQTDIDKDSSLNIKPRKAEFPLERAEKLTHSLSDITVPEETIVRRADAPVENIICSFHDDYIRENARFRSRSGLKCYISRTTDGKCCEWCSKISGRYDYDDVRAEFDTDIFRRHDNCSCKVTFENGRQRQDVWSKKTWEVPDTPNPYKPTVFSRDEGKRIESDNIHLKRLTKNENNDIIKLRSLSASGALNYEGEDSKRAEEHAKKYYAAVRKMSTDVKRISDNTGFPEELIKSIKNFIFNEKHDLGDKYDYFVPDYKMAQSWQRLIDGKNIQQHDLTLLRHEKMERELIQKGFSQEEAHAITSKKYNYGKEAKKYYDKIRKNKKN